MKYLLIGIVFFVSLLSSDEYELGHGLKVHDMLYLGSYFSIDYQSSEEKKQFRVDDVAFLAYGEVSSDFSYLLELESAPTYVNNFTTDTSIKDTKFHYERAYINYMHSEILNARLGKQITPIGYWNLEPINVLRDTSSNPFYSYVMFPKLLTGIDLFGYLDEDNTIRYHIFGQKNEDLDPNYINIQNEDFVGASIGYEFLDEYDIGASLGEYVTTEDDKHIKLIQANAKYDSYPFLLQGEIAYNEIDNRVKTKKSNNLATYVQGMYNINMKHALITRYEYFNDDENFKEYNVGIFGYSYRPLYSISIKAEYQWNSNEYYSKSFISFSVLF